MVTICALAAACSSGGSGEAVGGSAQRLIYGTDDRLETELSVAETRRTLGVSSAALIDIDALNMADSWHIGLRASELQERVGVCSDEPFADQPTAALCSATLIAPDLVLTAGHCVTSDTCPLLRVVFDYVMSTTGLLNPITEQSVYDCREVVVRRLDGMLDYAVVRLDRLVEGRAAVRVRLGDRAAELGDSIFAIGYPNGLPQKVVDGAEVRDPRAEFRDYFLADIDSFSGSSGSGVYDAATNELVGILVRGPEGGFVELPGEACLRAQRVPQDHPERVEIVYVQRALEELCREAPTANLCSCGDGVCEGSLREDTASCPADCGSWCGDGACNASETATSCYQDCGRCGNGNCEQHEVAYLSCCGDCGCPAGYECATESCLPEVGNVNGDERVDAADVAAIRGALSSNSVLPYDDAEADVDCDGSVSELDVRYLSELLDGHRAFLPCQAVSGVAMGLRHSCALTGRGVLCWGDNSMGQLGTNRVLSANASAADAIPVPAGGRPRRIAAGNDHTCILDDLGRVACWGSNQVGQLGREGRGSENSFAWLSLGAAARQVIAGANHSCALLADGRVSCWGDNHWGQLGRGRHTAEDGMVPAEVQLLGAAIEIAAGGNHTCALMETGEVRCWGANLFGQLGLGHNRVIGEDESPSSEPAVGVGGRVEHIRAHWMHTCAILENGEVRCWGDNSFGQLGYSSRSAVGDDETPSIAGPVDLGPGLVDLALGQSRTCALYRDGGVRCWGMNQAGQLGYGHTQVLAPELTPASLPLVPLAGPARQLYAGAQQTCAVLERGDLSCWGVNQAGQLGYEHRQTIGDDESPAAAGGLPPYGGRSAEWQFVAPAGLEIMLRQDGSSEQGHPIALSIQNHGELSLANYRAVYLFSSAEAKGSDVVLTDLSTPRSSPHVVPEAAPNLCSLIFDYDETVVAPRRDESCAARDAEMVTLGLSPSTESTESGCQSAGSSTRAGEGSETDDAGQAPGPCDGSWDPSNDYSSTDRARRRGWYRTSRVQLLGQDETVVYGWTRRTGP